MKDPIQQAVYTTVKLQNIHVLSRQAAFNLSRFMFECAPAEYKLYTVEELETLSKAMSILDRVREATDYYAIQQYVNDNIVKELPS